MSTPMQQIESSLKFIRGLGEVDELIAASMGEKLSPEPVNSHIHLPPNFSAFATVEDAVRMADSEGVAALGASNYYDYLVYGRFSSLAQNAGIFPIYGTELIGMVDNLRDQGIRINDPGNPGKIYLCGKAITWFASLSNEARRYLDVIRGNDRHRMLVMIEKMNDIFAKRGVLISLDESSIINHIVMRYACPRESIFLQERHVAQAYQECVFERFDPAVRMATVEKLLDKPSKMKSPEDAATLQGELRSTLMKSGCPAFVEETFIDIHAICTLILELGGYPCYPVLADGAAPICEFEESAEALGEKLKSLGIFAAEFIPSRNQPEVLEHFVTTLRHAGIIVTAGTEHNTPGHLPIDPKCAGGVEMSEKMRAIFWEGACVAAAHQYLTLNGCTGYIDANGLLNQKVGSQPGRIESLASLGQAVIRRFQCAGKNKKKY